MRQFYRITAKDNTGRYKIPKGNYREKIAIPYRTAVQPIVGHDGGVDLHGDLRSPKEIGEARIFFDMLSDCAAGLQAEIDQLLVAVEGVDREEGLRKLWRYEQGDGSAQRWTWARPVARPQIERDGNDPRHAGIVLELLLPDPTFYEAATLLWLQAQGYTVTTLAANVVPEDIAPDLSFATFAIAATPFAFTITNRGDLESENVIFRFVSQAAPGFTNPTVDNLTTEQQFSSTTDGATAATILSIGSPPGRAWLSVDAGVTFVDDTPALSLGPEQAVLMTLWPGDNAMQYADGGAPNLDLLVWWRHRYKD